MGANSYVYRGYRGKTGRRGIFAPLPILNKFKDKIVIFSKTSSPKETVCGKKKKLSKPRKVFYIRREQKNNNNNNNNNNKD